MVQRSTSYRACFLAVQVNSQVGSTWGKTVGSKLMEDSWRFWNAVRTSYSFPRPSLRSDSEESSALLPGHGASRISSRSSGHTATGSQTPDLGTVREAADSRRYVPHRLSCSRAAHPLRVGVSPPQPHGCRSGPAFVHRLVVAAQ